MLGRATAIAWLTVISAVPAYAQGDAWFRQSTKPKDFAAPRLPWNTFTLELPKNWVVAPGFQGTLVRVIERGKSNRTAGSISLEQTRLVSPVTADDVNATLAELEANLAHTLDPSGSDFAHEVKEVDGRKFVFVTYTRPGLNGPDSVVLYAFPTGTVMYRIVCIAPSSEVAKYQPVFAHVASSFKTSSNGTD